MSTLRIAVGPELPEFGSWNWIGGHMLSSLPDEFSVDAFSPGQLPERADVVVFLKFLPPVDVLTELSRRSRIVFMPVDIYGSCRDIELQRKLLGCIDLVISHSHRQLRYFAGICRAEYLHHPLRYTSSDVKSPDPDGPVVWVGKSCNVQPVVDWVTDRELDRELHVLTDEPDVVRKSFRNKGNVQVRLWSEESHIASLDNCAAAVDIKADDFRARHKPPAKCVDFLAAGIPVITNKGSSTDLFMRSAGLQPLYTHDWCERLTPQYTATIAAGSSLLREQCSSEAVAKHLGILLHSLTSVPDANAVSRDA